MSNNITIRPAAAHEMPLIVELVRELAEYERLEHEMTATAEDLAAALFGPQACAEVVFGCLDDIPVGYALFLRTFSEALGQLARQPR